MRQSKLYFQDSVSDVFLRSSYSSSQQSAIVFPRCTVYIIINYFVTGRFQCDESRLFGSPQFQKKYALYKDKNLKNINSKKERIRYAFCVYTTSDITSTMNKLQFGVAHAIVFQKVIFGC